MKYRSLLMLVIGSICLFFTQSKAQQYYTGKDRSIIIEMALPEGFKKELIHLETIPADYAVRPKPEVRIPNVSTNFVKWKIPSDSPLLGNLSSIFGPAHIIHLYEPGDSIHIDIRAKETVYSGKGAEKLKLLKQVKENSIATRTIYISEFDQKKNSPDYYEIKSLNDYKNWDDCFNKEEEILDSVLNAHKEKISSYAFNRLKAEKIVNIESARLSKFHMLMTRPAEFDVTQVKLGKIFDALVENKYAQWLHSYTGKVTSPSYFYDFIRKSVQRRYNFKLDHDSLKGAGRKIQYAKLGKELYRDRILQDFLVYLVTSQGLTEHTYKDGSTPEIELLLNDFYRSSASGEYKKYVEDYENWIRNWLIQPGHNAADFSLEDENGKLYSKEDLRGKLVVLNFYDASKGSMDMMTALEKVQGVFSQNSDVVFVNVSTEKNKAVWKRSLASRNSYANNFINLYTNGLGRDHPVLKYYNVKAYPEFDVKAYPKVFLLDSRGQFVYWGEVLVPGFNIPLIHQATDEIFPDPRKDNGQTLINAIYKHLPLLKDGPYVLYGKSGFVSYNLHSSKVSNRKFRAKSRIHLDSQTDDLRKTFVFPLKNNLNPESAVTAARPEKLFVLSDIEGNFSGLRMLLQANKIIDDEFNWTFGKGHLVFAGDMFDRGLQVTECLWLVYALEEKAKAVGGYVHFVLGNHEIMNLQGDHRYVEDKYKENAKLIGKTLTQLYNEDSELGRWLRTKNIIEKIGDLLFMHGGFSQELNNQPLSVEQLNSTARPFYADNKAAENVDTKVSQLYKSATSPFWYRLYYKESQSRGIYKAKESQVDSTLQKFNVKHIITGHTIIADTITTHYNNKVINTDTKHKDGKSEALLIEGNSFYRVNAEEKRVLLFRDEER
jgi:peroxiredoxin